MISKRFFSCVVAVLGVSFFLAPHAGATTAPTMTAPSEGSSFCSVSGTDFSAAGQGTAGTPVTVLVNGSSGPQATPAEDGTYTVPLDEPPGSYTLNAQQDDGSGPAQSADVHVSVYGASDVIGAVGRSTSVISPSNADGYHDSTALTVPIMKSGGFVQFQIVRGTTVVRHSPVSTVNAGSSASFTWDGKGDASYNNGAFVPDGTYTVNAYWVNASNHACRFVASTSVVVDNTVPSITSYDESDAFYPRTDDAISAYKNLETFSWGTPSENTYVQVEIIPPGTSTPLGTLTKGWTTSPGSMTWSGHKSDGSLWPAGTYHSSYKLTDAEHHVKISTPRPFTLSWQHVVAKTATYTLNANQMSSHFVNGCGQIDPGSSYWANGEDLFAYDCNVDDSADGPDAADMTYTFSVPSGVSYGDLTYKVGGYSIDNDALFGFVHNFTTGDPDVVGYVQGTTRNVRSFGTVHNAGKYVSSGHHVSADVFLFSACDCKDVEYDVANVTMSLTYGVLTN